MFLDFLLRKLRRGGKGEEKRALARINEKLSRLDSEATDREEADRLYDLGICYNNGLEGYPVDLKKAYELYLKAARAGHTGAMLSLAYGYSHHDEIPGYNLAKAASWARKTVESGNPDGYRALYTVYEEKGMGRQAFEAIEKGVLKGSLVCIEWLANLLYWGKEIGQCALKRDKNKALELLSNVEWDDSHPFALQILAHIFWDKGNTVLAGQYFRRAINADPEDYSLMAQYATMLRIEENVRDFSRAAELLSTAAEGGCVAAMDAYGTMLALGEGVAPDKEAALEWFRKAAEAGSVQALKNIDYLLSMDE